jgi:hypothetical protein
MHRWIQVRDNMVGGGGGGTQLLSLSSAFPSPSGSQAGSGLEEIPPTTARGSAPPPQLSTQPWEGGPLCQMF